MEAIAFTAQPKNGVIEIPKEYLKNLKNEIQVILLIDAKKLPKKRAPKDRKIKSLQIKTKGLKIDREKLNVR